MENKPTVDIQAIENKFNEDLHRYLSSIGKVDERMPEAPDLEELWPKLAESYLPDGVREFAGILTGREGSTVTVDTDAGAVTFEVNAAASVNLCDDEDLFD